MSETPLAEKLTFLQSHRQQDEVTVLAQAVRQGIDALYREALVESYLLGQTSRERVLREIGPEALAAIEYQRDALRQDVAWGINGG